MTFQKRNHAVEGFLKFSPDSRFSANDPEDHMTAGGPRVFVGVPCVGWMHTLAVLAQRQLVLPPASQWFFDESWSTIAEKRNHIIEEFLRSECEYLFSLDSDMTPRPDSVRRLLEHQKDIVGALYCTRFPSFPVTAGRRTSPDGRGHIDGGLGWPISPGQGLQRVDAAGIGAMLIGRRVLQTLEPPWCEWPQPMGGTLDDSIAFCDKARTAGFELWTDSDLEVGHLITWPVTPSCHPEPGHWTFPQHGFDALEGR